MSVKRTGQLGFGEVGVGRRPTEGELYMAVFLGADGAVKWPRS